MENFKTQKKETEKEVLDLMQYDFCKFTLKQLALKIKNQKYKTKLKTVSF